METERGDDFDPRLNAFRSPPHNVEAEKALIGAILANNLVHERVVEFLRPEHFALGQNGRIFEACGKLVENGQIADPVTLRRMFEQEDALAEIGGIEYLAELAASAVGVINAGEYARLIHDLFLKRELIDFAQDVIDEAYGGDLNDDATHQIERAESRLFGLSHVGPRGGPQPLTGYVDASLRTAEVAYQSGQPAGLDTGLIDLDQILGGLHPTDLIILAGRPSMGKSALASNIAFNVATHAFRLQATPAVPQIEPALFFSLEMSGEQVAIRELSGRAGFSSHLVRQGRVGQEQIQDLIKSGEQMRHLPIWIDERPALSVQMVRTTARRFKRTHGLSLVVVDYLQLMSAETKRRSDSRVQEVTEITAGLKTLAKELGVPVLALSQLSRAVEQRENKRPQLSDLRESGCLSSETTLLVSSEAVRYNHPSPMFLSCLDDRGRMKNHMSSNFAKKDQRIVRVQLKSGRFIDCTPDHPILTDRGWIGAADLTTDHAVACAARIPEPARTRPIPEARWIGWMLGNGSMIGNASPSFICSDAELARQFIAQTKSIFGLTPKDHPHLCAAVWQYDITAGPVRTSAGNPCKNWLRDRDLWGRRAPEKRIPSWFMEQADNHSIAEILGGLIDTDGSVPQFTTRKGTVVKFSTTSRLMAWQVVWCFLRLGIFARITDEPGSKNPKHHRLYTVMVSDGPTVQKLRKKIRLTGAKGGKLAAGYVGSGSNHGNRLGPWAGAKLVEISRERGVSQEKLGYRNQGKRISQDDLRHYLKKIGGHEDLNWLTSSDIWWDRLKSITEIGVGPTFDRQMAGKNHNFVANGIIVHNSIEQDADVVIFLYREEYYLERDYPEQRQDEKDENFQLRLDRWKLRLGDVRNIAEAIIAKQRHGPIGTVKLQFSGATTQFQNLGTM